MLGHFLVLPVLWRCLFFLQFFYCCVFRTLLAVFFSCVFSWSSSPWLSHTLFLFLNFWLFLVRLSCVFPSLGAFSLLFEFCIFSSASAICSWLLLLFRLWLCHFFTLMYSLFCMLWFRLLLAVFLSFFFRILWLRLLVSVLPPRFSAC